VSAEQVGAGRGILDTSTFIFLRRLPDAAVLPDEPMITAVTLAELAVGPLVASGSDERARRQAHLQWAEADFVSLPFDIDAARAFGAVSAAMHGAGRKVAARGYDAMIAAIAIANDLPVYTCNPGDFEGIDRLKVVPVPVPE